MNFADFSENMVALSLIFLNVVTPVFILVAVGYFIGPLLKIEARPLSRPGRQGYPGWPVARRSIFPGRFLPAV